MIGLCRKPGSNFGLRRDMGADVVQIRGNSADIRKSRGFDMGRGGFDVTGIRNEYNVSPYYVRRSLCFD